jgi:hypothetical protein
VKRKLAVVVLVLLAVVTGLWFLARLRPHGINQDGFDQITVGMTQQEVEETLRRPPGNYTERLDRYDDLAKVTDAMYWANLWEVPHRWQTLPRREVWQSDNGVVLVGFDDNGKVREKYFSDIGLTHERTWRERAGWFLDRNLPSSLRAYVP